MLYTYIRNDIKRNLHPIIVLNVISDLKLNDREIYDKGCWSERAELKFN